MNEHNDNLASAFSVEENQKHNRKEPKQISFRVSVPNFIKKKAHDSRL